MARPLRDHIVRAVRDSHVDPSGLVFEVTETVAVQRMNAAREFADDLRQVGCRFALDDFGAGFGSFYVKIDGEFIRSCMSNRTDRLVIDSVVAIAKGLGKETIAEFVGDEQTLDFLRRQDVDHAQGYHVGRPLPISEAFPQLYVPAQRRSLVSPSPSPRRLQSAG